ncbi:MAG: DUF3810 domain-containing protein, partial [Clostridia bacterium]|nr:DUF3810 domain-containing protein [Clostridia bacterium]
MKLRGILKNTLWLLPALLALGLFLWLPDYPAVAEWVCARGVFRVVNTVLSVLTGLLPFSLTELAVTLAVPAVLIWLVLFVIRLCCCVHKGRFLAAVGRGLAWTLSCAALLYMFTHGCNFYRYSTAELMEMDTTTCTPGYLQAVVIDLAEKASAAREEVKVDANGFMTLSEPLDLTLAMADDGYRELQEDYPFLWGASYRTKAVELSYWWSYTGISGMYFPLFGESNVNVAQPKCDIPSTAAHEMAHSRGFAREDECNFYAYLSCIANPSADYRYSGYILAYVYCANALYGYDLDMWREARAHLSEDVARDLSQRGAFWDQFEGEVEEVSTSVNNSFITS